MHKVSTKRKTFSKILVAIDELNKSTASTDKAVDYAANIASWLLDISRHHENILYKANILFVG